MDLEQQLRAALAPCEPGPAPLAVVMAQLNRARPASSKRHRRGGPIILLGFVLAVAAAAGILGTRLMGGSAQATAEWPVVAGTPAEVPPEQLLLQPDDSGDRPAQPASSTFTVLVQPLQLDTEGGVVESQVREYYNALVDGLRLVPGLVVVPPGAASLATTPADFRITVSGEDARNEFTTGTGTWRVSLRTEERLDGDYRPAVGGTIRVIVSMNAKMCLEGPDRDCGLAGMAADHVEQLVYLFPSSPALEELRARYRDEAAALKQALSTPENILRQRLPQPPGATPVDADLIRQILDRIAVVPEPGPRAALWTSLRGQKYPEQLPVLMKALREEPADVVRQELITQLALGFAEDPAARDVLASVAEVEPQALPRHVAERALFGDGPWRVYASAALRDSRLSTAQRLDPLTWMLDVRQLYPRVGDTFTEVLPALLEGDGARMLAGLLSSRKKESANLLEALKTESYVARIGASNAQAAPDLLVAWFDVEQSEQALRLLAPHRDDARVRNKLEAIVAYNAEPVLRRLAASYLRGTDVR